jgi:hypothetical protein
MEPPHGSTYQSGNQRPDDVDKDAYAANDQSKK